MGMVSSGYQCRTWGPGGIDYQKGMVLLFFPLSLHMMNILPRVLQFVRFFRGSQGDRLSHFTLFLMQIRTPLLPMKYLVAYMLTSHVVAIFNFEDFVEDLRLLNADVGGLQY